MKMAKKEPKIVCLMCNFAFCQSEDSVPTNVNVARVNCIGRIDPEMILETFEKGADGVMLVGCKPPDCHYVEGNLQAERAVKMTSKLLTLTGLGSERLRLLWYSPLETVDLNHHAREFSDEIKRLGLSPLKGAKPDSSYAVGLLAARNAAAEFRLRVLLGREKELTEELNVYNEKLPQEEFDKMLNEILEEELTRYRIYLLARNCPLSVKMLAESMNMKPAAVLKEVVNMRRRNMIGVDKIEDATPLYKALEVK